MQNMKFRIKDAGQSAKLQECLFGLGYGWALGKVVMYTDQKVIVAWIDEYSFNSKCLSYGGCFVDGEETDTEAFIAEHTKEGAVAPSAPQSFTIEHNSPWVENMGEMPVDGKVQIDVDLRGRVGYTDVAARFDWKITGDSGDIIKWRYHKPEDYYKQPASCFAYKDPVESNIKVAPVSAVSILEKAIAALSDRATERDHEANGERSMKRCVESFNAMFGHTLSVREGWHFMQLLKMARSANGNFRLDDFLDMSAYAALAGEEQ